MNELSETFRIMREADKERRSERLKDAGNILSELTRHTDYHYSTTLQGKRLDYWPSGGKWMWKNKIFYGNVDNFIGFLRKRGLDLI